MSIKQNITSLQDLLEQVNALPEAGGTELPELSNPAIAAEVFANKELIDADGNKIVGTFTIENELNVQDDLIAQIQAVVDELPEAGGTTLPTLTNPATAENLEEGYELIDGDGNVVVGTHVCESCSGGGNELSYFYYFDSQRAIGSFRIYFESGMTWQNFVNSDYNIALSESFTADFGRFSSDQDGVYDNVYSSIMINLDNGILIQETDLIIPNCIYGS